MEVTAWVTNVLYTRKGEMIHTGNVQSERGVKG